MADSSRTLEVVINAKDNASKTVEGIGSRFSKAVSQLTVGSAAITGALGLVAKSTIQVGIDMESARTSFTTFLGSGEKAGKLLKDLSDFAIKTPFDLPQVVDGTKRLLAYGITADNVIPTFKMLGDLSSGNKDKLNSLTLAYGQVRAATKLTGAELRQFTEAGIPLLEQLGKQSGRTAGQVKEAMEDGAVVSFEEVEKALSSMTEEGGMFFNNMEDQSKTLGGILSNTRDEFVRFSLSILGFTEEGEIRQGSVFYYLKEGATKFLGILQEVRPEVQNFFDSFMQNTPAVIGVIAAITAMMIPLALAVLGATWPILAVGAAAGIAAFEVATMADRFMTVTQNTQGFEAALLLLFPGMDTLISKSMEVKYATDADAEAKRMLKQATEELEDAQLQLTDANLRAREASLSVEKATKNYNDLLKKHGPDSLLTRDAALALERADIRLQQANKDVAKETAEAGRVQREEFVPATKKSEEAAKILEEANKRTANSFDRVKDSIQGALAKFGEWVNKTAGSGFDAFKGSLGFQHGGLIPGAFNQAVPAVLHGGERVTPRMGVDVNGGGGGGNNISINITGSFQLDSNSRMNEFADMVIEKLNRQNELAGKGVSV